MKKTALTLSLLFLAACSQNAMPTDTKAGTDAADITLLSGTHTVILKTSMGDITLALNANAAPKTVTNFVTHAKNGYYDDLTFHRVIDGFMIQGGDPGGNGTGGESVWGGTFEDEINAESYGLHEKKLADFTEEHLPEDAKDMTIKDFYELNGFQYNSDLESLPMVKGAIAMANRGPNTNGSQFFIIQSEGTPWLEGKHTVFGNVTGGMDVIDAMAKVDVDQMAKPTEDITFTVEVVE